MNKESKIEKVEILKSIIERDLKAGIVIEKQNCSPVPCLNCAYGKICRTHKDLPCMAHNRASKDSIYYSIV